MKMIMSITESINPLSTDLDKLSSLDIVRVFKDDLYQLISAIEKAENNIANLIDLAAEALSKGASIIYVGAGTSGRLGILDAVECPPTFSSEPNMVKAIIAGGEKAIKDAVEGAEDNENLGREDILSMLNLDKDSKSQDLVIGISASGGAAYVEAAMQTASKFGAITALITNNPEAKIKNIVPHSVILNTGAEILSGSTRLKAGTAQKIVLNMISTGAMVKIGKTFGNLMIDVKVSNKKLKTRAINLISLITKCEKEIAERALGLSYNKVKQAILYIEKNLDFNSATKLLDKHAGFLSKALLDN